MTHALPCWLKAKVWPHCWVYMYVSMAKAGIKDRDISILTFTVSHGLAMTFYIYHTFVSFLVNGLNSLILKA